MSSTTSLEGELSCLSLKPDIHATIAHVAAYPIPNEHLCKSLGKTISSSNGVEVMREGGEETRTDLDSHANMCVVGNQVKIVNRSGRHAEVNAFSPDLESLQRVPIIDAAIAYDCPYSMKTFILIV